MRNLLFLLFLILSHIARAQTCAGGLGDPIVNITFGAGTKTFGGALAAGITTMQYVEDQCPNDGTYTITSHSNGCFTGVWPNINADHTGDPNGYFMLINASQQPSDFYVQTVSGLCPSTSYQFAAWILNMGTHSDEIYPNITFNIEQTDGTVLQSFKTGDIPETFPAAWAQYAFYFTTPPGVSTVVIRMTNNAPGGYGNDLAIDDITFRTSGPAVDISIAGFNSNVVTLCPNAANNLQFTGTVESCYPSTDYQWQESADNGSSWTDLTGAVTTAYPAYPTVAGNYLYRLAAAQTGNMGITTCRVVSGVDSIFVLRTAYPAVSIGIDQGHVCADSLASFTATSTDGGASPFYQWLLNGAPVGTGGSTYINNTLATGDQLSCILTSNAACADHPVVNSNTLSMNILPDVASAVNITASANNICQDSLISFTAAPSNGGSQPVYQWLLNGQPTGLDTSIFTSAALNDGDQISAVMTGSLSCSSPVTSNIIAMTVHQRPRIQLTPDTIIAGGSHLILAPLVTGPPVTYQWSPASSLNDPLLPDPLASPVSTTTYELDVQTDKGCAAAAKEHVVVFYDLVMPNAFTPNGDGRNDLFRIPPSITVTIQHFSIYDRWGALVFSTSNSSEGWNGRIRGQAQPAGVYIWMVEYYDPILKKQRMKKGTVALIR